MQTTTTAPSAFYTGPALSTGTDTWTTPRATYEELDREFGFVLDAAALESSALVPGNWYGPDHPDTARRDALACDWVADSGGGAVWLNPPYSRPFLAPFIRKAWAESQRGCTVVLLIPSRTDTAVWHDYVMRGEVRFVRGRLKFGDGKAPAPFPSAVVVFRPRALEVPAQPSLFS